jgi:hypothetical protein
MKDPATVGFCIICILYLIKLLLDSPRVEEEEGMLAPLGKVGDKLKKAVNKTGDWVKDAANTVADTAVNAYEKTIGRIPVIKVGPVDRLQCGPNEEKNGLLCYPKCKAGYHNVGCCTCSIDCPPGFNDYGIGCSKPSYDRGAGRSDITVKTKDTYGRGAGELAKFDMYKRKRNVPFSTKKN